MITTINEFRKINEENLLIPRRLEDRHIKKRQNNLRMLQQEVIDGDLFIDGSFSDFTKEQVKVKQINGHVKLMGFDHIPEWLKYVTVKGDFECSANNLTSLENRPKVIEGGFACSSNNLTSLEGCLENINGYFSCSYNPIISLKGCPKFVNGNFYFYQLHGGKFTLNDIKELCDVEDVIFI